MKIVTRVCAALCITISSISLMGQAKPSPYEVGFHLGSSLYLGDLIPTFAGTYKSPGFFYGIDGTRIINRRFSLRGSLSHGKVKANDANYKTPQWRQERNFNFKTFITEIVANLVWNPLGNNRLINPYLFAGIGYSFLNVKRDYSNFNENYFAGEPKTLAGLNADIAHRLPNGIAVLPVGAGLRYPISNKLSLNLETAYRFIKTDYLDGFSEAANPKRRDAYFTHTAGLIYAFGSKNMLACPTK